MTDQRPCLSVNPFLNSAAITQCEQGHLLPMGPGCTQETGRCRPTVQGACKHKRPCTPSRRSTGHWRARSQTKGTELVSAHPDPACLSPAGGSGGQGGTGLLLRGLLLTSQRWTRTEQARFFCTGIRMLVSNALPLLPLQKSDGIYTVSEPASPHHLDSLSRKSAEEGGLLSDLWKGWSLRGWLGSPVMGSSS